MAEIICRGASTFGGFWRDGQDQTTSMVEDQGQITLILEFGIIKTL